MEEHDLSFSEEAMEGLTIMFSQCENIVAKTMKSFEFTNEELAREVLEIESEIDILESENRKGHIARLNKSICTTEPGIMFLDTIGNLERVADHSVNIAMYVLDNYK